MSSDVEINNLKAAMSKVVESEDMRIGNPNGSGDDSIVDKQVLIRVSEKDRERWKKSAEISGKSLSLWIRDILNKESSLILDCPHPLNEMKYYPWAQICTRCGMRVNLKKSGK